MTFFDILNLPSLVILRLVGEIDSTTQQPKVTLKPVSLLKRQLDNDPTNDVLIAEIPLVFTADKEGSPEEFFLINGVENNDGSVTYDTEVRGIGNVNNLNPPTTSLSRNFRVHRNDAICIVDETWITRALKRLLLQGSTQDEGEAGEDIGNKQPVSIAPDGKIRIYNSVNFPEFAGISTSEVLTGNTVSFIVPGGVSVGHVGLTPGVNEFAENAVVAPAAAIAALKSGAGNVDIGAHAYKVVHKNSTGITIGGATSNSVAVADNTVDGQIDVTSIEISSDSRVTERDVYRQFNGVGAFKFAFNLADNTTTIFTDNIANASLGVDLITVQTISGITEQISNTTEIAGFARPDGTSIRLIAAPITDLILATQLEAEEGTDDIKYMSPLKVKQAITKLAPEVLAGSFNLTGTRSTSVSPRVLRWTDILSDGVYEVRRSVSKPNPKSISSVADFDGTEPGTVLITAGGHGLTTGDIINISETGAYEGEHRVTVVNSSTFHIDHDFSATATGEFYLLFGFLTSTAEDVVTFIDNEPVEGTVQYIVTARTDDNVEKTTPVLTFLGSTLLTFTGTDFGDGSDGAYAGGDLERGVIHQFTSFDLNAPMNFIGEGLAIILVAGNVTLQSSAVLNSSLTVVPVAAFGEGTVQGNAFDITGGRGTDGIKGNGGGGALCLGFIGDIPTFGGAGGNGGIAGSDGLVGAQGFNRLGKFTSVGGAGVIAPGANGGGGGGGSQDFPAGGGGGGASGGLPFLHDGVLFIISGNFDDQSGSEWVGQGDDSGNAGNGGKGGDTSSGNGKRAAGGGGGGGSGPGGGHGVKIHVFHLGTQTGNSTVDGDPGDGGNGGSGGAAGSGTGNSCVLGGPAQPGAAGQAGAQGDTGNILFTQLV